MVKDKRLPYKVCMDMPVRDIRKTSEYASLTPLGKENKSGKYRFGNKSYLRKKDLCAALDDPDTYHKKIAAMKSKKVNAGPRKRGGRAGKCPVHRNKEICPSSHPHKGLTTTGNSCCYKKKQSKKVVEKRLKAKAAKKTSKKKTSTRKPRKSTRKPRKKTTRGKTKK